MTSGRGADQPDPSAGPATAPEGTAATASAPEGSAPPPETPETPETVGPVPPTECEEIAPKAAAWESGGQPKGWHSAAWAQEVWVDIVSIGHSLRIALASGNAASGDPQRHLEVAAAVRAHLRSACDAASGRPRKVMAPIDWWRGTSIERAFRSVHAARIALVELLSAEQMQMLVPATIARISACLPATDLRRIAVEGIPKITDPATRCAAVQTGLALSYEASDQVHQRVRGFRNLLLSTAAVIALFMAAFVLVVALSPSTVPFCFTPGRVTAAPASPTVIPQSTTSVAPSSATPPTSSSSPSASPAPTTTTTPQSPPPTASAMATVCPSGDTVQNDPKGPRQPSSADIAIVAGLGLLGGALASAVAIRKVSGASTPYGVPTALALLKVPTGALTAVAGILLLGGNFVPGLSELDNQRQILAYALVLGYAQQLATRLLDDRASTLLATVPDKRKSASTQATDQTDPSGAKS